MRIIITSSSDNVLEILYIDLVLVFPSDSTHTLSSTRWQQNTRYLFSFVHCSLQSSEMWLISIMKVHVAALRKDVVSDGSMSVILECVSFLVKCWRSGNMETERGAVASADPGPAKSASMCRVQFPSVLSLTVWTILSKAHLYLWFLNYK